MTVVRIFKGLKILSYSSEWEAAPDVVCLQLRLKKKIGIRRCGQTHIYKHMVRHGKLLCRTLLTYLCPHDAMGLCGVLLKWLNGSRSQLFQTGPAIVSL